MATPKNETSYVKILISIAFFGLVLMGVLLIYQSNQIYDQSFRQSEVLAKKVLDTSYKGAVTISAPTYASIKDGYSQALSYFMLALGALFVMVLLPRLQTFSLSPTGGINITLKNLTDNVQALVKQTNIIQSSSTGAGGKQATPTQVGRRPPANLKGLVANAEHQDDPQKGKWGGLRERNSRRISAEVEVTEDPNFYKVTITVESKDPNLPLKGFVKFHLHNTFRNPDPVIAVENGKAELVLTRVYGAFTVGAEADDGQTLLELDLAEVVGGPEDFKTR